MSSLLRKPEPLGLPGAGRERRTDVGCRENNQPTGHHFRSQEGKQSVIVLLRAVTFHRVVTSSPRTSRFLPHEEAGAEGSHVTGDRAARPLTAPKHGTQAPPNKSYL